MTKINFEFISTLEGGLALTGYVPDASKSKSGVTIATGFDLGQRSTTDLLQLLPENLALKLSDYCLLQGEQAAQQLIDKPLTVSKSEATTINTCYKQTFINKLKHSYNQRSNVTFEQLPEQAQTVIASVAFQYGNLAKRCPTFWKYAVAQNWLAMVNELRHFGDRYPNRRHKEADYFIQGKNINGEHK